MKNSHKNSQEIIPPSDVRKAMEEQKKEFDKSKTMFAEIGIDLMEDRSSRYLARWKEALAKIEKGDLVLDVGSGWLPESTFNLITQEYKLNYFAFDIDPKTISEMADRMSRIGLPKSNFSSGEISTLPFEKQFHMVFSSHCLEHATNIISALNEIHRVLIDGGILFMSVPLGFDLSEEHLLFLGPNEWEKILQFMGFEIISTTIGSVYTQEGDLTICARQVSSFQKLKSQAEKIANKFTKVGLTFIPHHSEYFYYTEKKETENESILTSLGQTCTIKCPGKPKALILTCHPWSGCLIISDGKKQYTIDCYSTFQWRRTIDLEGFSETIEIQIAGSNSLSFGAEGVIFGLLLEEDKTRG